MSTWTVTGPLCFEVHGEGFKPRGTEICGNLTLSMPSPVPSALAKLGDKLGCRDFCSQDLSRSYLKVDVQLYQEMVGIMTSACDGPRQRLAHQWIAMVNDAVSGTKKYCAHIEEEEAKLAKTKTELEAAEKMHVQLLAKAQSCHAQNDEGTDIQPMDGAPERASEKLTTEAGEIMQDRHETLPGVDSWHSQCSRRG